MPLQDWVGMIFKQIFILLALHLVIVVHHLLDNSLHPTAPSIFYLFLSNLLALIDRIIVILNIMLICFFFIVLGFGRKIDKKIK